jgi:hypothetical protein
MIELPNNIKRRKTLEAMLCAIGTEVRALRPVQTVFMATEDFVSPAVKAVFAPLLRDLIRKRRELGFTPGSAVETALEAGTISLKSAAPIMVQLVTEFLELHREVQALDVRNKTVKAVFFDCRGVYVFDVGTRYTYDGTPDVFMSSQLRDQQVSVEPMPLDNVDPIIRGRTDVLNIMEPLEFVPNVGLKHSDRLFYVVV